MTTNVRTTIPRFSLAERDRRWDLANAFMERRGLDALLVYGEHEDAGAMPLYFDTWFTNDRAGTTVLMPKGEEPVVLVPMPLYLLDRLEAERRGHDVWVSAPSVRLGRDAGTLIAAFRDLGLSRARIGVVGLDPHIPWHPEGVIPFRLMHGLGVELPEVEIVSVGSEFGLLLFQLSEEEVEVVRYTARIGDAMVEAMVEATRPGVSEAAVYTAGTAAALSYGTVVPGMHLWSGSEYAASGPPAWSYRPGEARIIQDGDVLMAEVFCNFGMRASQHQVTIAVGEVHEDIERAALIAGDAYRAGLAALRPGAAFGDIAEAMLAPVEAAGGWVRGPQVHALNPCVGLARIPANSLRVEGIEQYPNCPETPTMPPNLVLAKGMTFAFEPSCGFERHLVTVGGTVLVGDDGAEELNPRTAQLLRAGS
ncbi:putative peptidase [Lentzea pudingi]|uniref:Peptidase n=1 Tax=Lentzea pudingi TaxID=1789439 RepID=A0ABQ2HXN0_9PSEU|nr:aminopeptidase P family protein [Lentzea pudingi]GGM93799.1 putative peptidase [Lentzea pudingi]